MAHLLVPPCAALHYTNLMPIPRLRLHDTALLVIDVQDRLLPTIVDADRVVNNAALLVKLAVRLDLPYLVTEQYVRGLGRTAEPIGHAMADSSLRVEKTQFSGLIDIVDERLQSLKRSSVLVCGLEAHICVLQTVLDLQASGRQAYVVSDAVSAGQRDQVPYAFDRMRDAGAIITGVNSAMYELVANASHPLFRDCLKIAKAVNW